VVRVLERREVREKGLLKQAHCRFIQRTNAFNFNLR
jgi:hypothetical protein